MRTIKNQANDNSEEIGLLPNVYIVWDLRSIRVIGERLSLWVRHDSDVCRRFRWGEGGVRRKAVRGSEMKKRPRGSMRENAVCAIKAQGRSAEWWRMMHDGRRMGDQRCESPFVVVDWEVDGTGYSSHPRLARSLWKQPKRPDGPLMELNHVYGSRVKGT